MNNNISERLAQQQVFEDNDIRIEYCVKGFTVFRNGEKIHEVYHPNLTIHSLDQGGKN